MWSLVAAMSQVMLSWALSSRGLFWLRLSWWPLTWMYQILSWARVQVIDLMTWKTPYSLNSVWLGISDWSCWG